MTAPVAAPSGLDVARIRADFPILERQIGAHPLVYLDSAATSQKPRAVTDAVDAYYATSNANVHRGVHTLGNEATDAFERARVRVAAFIDAPSDGVVFVRNTTEAINLVASSYATQLLEPLIVNPPTGGRWKKLNAAALTTAVATPSQTPQVSETTSTAGR